MLEVILEGRILYVLMGIVAAVGILSKIAVNLSLKRLVWAAGNMNKSNHPLMRLVKAKFEHACMVSDTVENVGVFVDKYLYEYRVLGMKLHTLRRLEKAAAAGCLLLGASGAAGWYALEGMGDAVLRVGAAGAVLAIAVYLFHLTTDEGYRLKAVKNYMVDYLENVCRRKYEKAYQKEIQVMAPEAHGTESFQKVDEPEGTPVRETRVTEGRDQEAIDAAIEKGAERIRNIKQEPAVLAQAKEEQAEVQASEKQEKKAVDKDVLIRQILEEYMA